MNELRALAPRPAAAADESDTLSVPFSIEAEQQLLGALLTNNDVFDSITRLIRAEHFLSLIHI